jgi:hypothetical protein
MTLGKAILEVLDAARDSRPLTGKAILGLVRTSLATDPTLSEIDGELRVLEQRGDVVSLNDVDAGRLHKITAQGRARALS